MYFADNPLHRARVQRGMGLSQLAARTLLSAGIIRKIDEGRFAELPGGLYARSYIRAFASAVGLDPEEAVRELADRLPPAQDPFPVLREGARLSDPAWLTALNDVGPSATKWLAANTAGWTGMTRRTVAASIDASVLLTLLAVLIQVTAWTCGIHPQTLLESGSGALAVVWGIVLVLYFVLLGGIGGKTPGAFLSQMPKADESARQRETAMVAESATSVKHNDWGLTPVLYGLRSSPAVPPHAGRLHLHARSERPAGRLHA